MSAEPSPVPAPRSEAMSVDASNQPRKSFRRKYRKIMVKFEERMRESTNLFKDEQRIFDISQRLAEQTDQLLQLLVELNQSPEVPGSLRYDLKPSNIKVIPKPERHQDEHAAHETFRVGRYKIQKGDSTVPDYEESKKNILDSKEFAPSRSYTALSKITTLNPSQYDNSADPSIPSSSGYLTIRQEEQYLQSLDSFLNGKTTHARAHAINSLGSKGAEKTTDREREMQLRNPVSVYNWLRKHQPQVFLQDHETSNDKAKVRSSKRMSAKEAKNEDLYDEDGIAADYVSTMKGKRKRNDDAAFRPKGGKPGHGVKRRKEDSGKRSKRSSMDARVS